MDFAEFKNQIKQVPARSQADYSKLQQYSSIGGGIWPSYAEHLENASTLREFFEAIYNDDECRFDNAWAYWARMQRKRWVERFEPELVLYDVDFAANGILFEKDGLEFIIPVPVTAKRKRADVLVFPENGFNEAAANLAASINGSFTCAGQQFEGLFDVFVTTGALILEKWELDVAGYRQNDRRGTKPCCH